MTGPKGIFLSTGDMVKEALIEVPLHSLNRITDLAFMLRRRPAGEIAEIAAEIEKVVAQHIDQSVLQLDEIRRLGT